MNRMCFPFRSLIKAIYFYCRQTFRYFIWRRPRHSSGDREWEQGRTRLNQHNHQTYLCPTNPGTGRRAFARTTWKDSRQMWTVQGTVQGCHSKIQIPRKWQQFASDSPVQSVQSIGVCHGLRSTVLCFESRLQQLRELVVCQVLSEWSTDNGYVRPGRQQLACRASIGGGGGIQNLMFLLHGYILCFVQGVTPSILFWL